MELCRENLEDYLRGFTISQYTRTIFEYLSKENIFSYNSGLAGTPMSEEQGAFILKNLGIFAINNLVSLYGLYGAVLGAPNGHPDP